MSDAAQAARDKRSATDWARTLGRLLSGTVGFYLLALQIVEYNMHKPDVVRATDGPLVWFAEKYIQTPFAELIQRGSALIARIGDIHFAYQLQDKATALTVASTLIAAGGIFLLYNSFLGLLRIYDATEAVAVMRNFAFLVISILLLPFAVLSIVHVVKSVTHVQLIPLADNAVQDYMTITRAAADRFYHLIVPWHAPIFLKDAATISIISVGINRKAWLRDEAGYYDLDWDGFRQWVQSMFLISTVFDALELIPQLIAVVFGFALGRLLLLLRLRWLAERSAALTYVLARGVLLVGLVYPFDHLYRLYRLRGDESEQASTARGAALWYMAFMGITLALVAWFLLAFAHMTPGR